MRRAILAAVVATGAAGCAAWAAAPEEVEPRAAAAWEASARTVLDLWAAVAANPGPVILAGATFLFTVLYHAARGKSLREAVDATVTKVHVPLSAAVAVEPEAAVTRRAKLRATRNQLLMDQIALQNRLRKLPALVDAAERDADHARKAWKGAEENLADKRRHAELRCAELGALKAEAAGAAAELDAITAELARLAAEV